MTENTRHGSQKDRAYPLKTGARYIYRSKGLSHYYLDDGDVVEATGGWNGQWEVKIIKGRSAGRLVGTLPICLEPLTEDYYAG